MNPKNSTEPDSLFRHAFGYIFYFFEDPAKIRKKLINAVEALTPVFPAPFSRVKDGGDLYKNFGKSMMDVVKSVLEKSDFKNTELYSFTNASNDRTQDQQLAFNLITIQDWFPKKVPNYIYVETALPMDDEAKWHVFRNLFTCHEFHLAFGNPILAINHERLPQSGSQAVRYLMDKPNLKEFYSTWGNLSYLENAGSFLEGPNAFVGGKMLWDRLSFDDVLDAKKRGDFYFECGEDSTLLRADTDEQWTRLGRFLSPLFCSYGKPDLFWKKEQWAEWRQRVAATCATA